MKRDRFLFVLADLAAEMLERKMVHAAAMVLERRHDAAIHLSAEDLAELGLDPDDFAGGDELAPPDEPEPPPAKVDPPATASKPKRAKTKPSADAPELDTLAGRIHACVVDEQDPCSVVFVAEYLELPVTSENRKRIAKAMSALAGRGLLNRVGPGVYEAVR